MALALASALAAGDAVRLDLALGVLTEQERAGIVVSKLPRSVVT